MLRAIRNVFVIPELRRRLLFTFGLLVVYRLGCTLPLPGIDLDVLSGLMGQTQGSLLGLANALSGGSVERAAVFTLGIVPYITASITLQLLTVSVPYLEQLKKEGELGRRKITQYTRCLALVIAAVQSFSVAFGVEAVTFAGAPLVPHPGWGFRLLACSTLTAGCALVMWLGEQISERGIGNGISLIVFAGIVAGFPRAVASILTKVNAGVLHPATVAALVVFLAILVGVIVEVERRERRIPLQYARRVVGRKTHGGQTTYLPLKVNSAGVIPVIFASSLLMTPATFAGLAPGRWTSLRGTVEALHPGEPLYYLLYGLAIVSFTFLYVSIIWNPEEVAENLRRQGGFIPGIRAGRSTADYVDRILTRLTWVGAFYLASVVIVPELLVFGFRVGSIPWIGPSLDRLLPVWMTTGIGIDYTFGGTSILIVVSVLMDFLRQVEGRLVMHRYDGFLRRSRRGSRPPLGSRSPRAGGRADAGSKTSVGSQEPLKG